MGLLLSNPLKKDDMTDKELLKDYSDGLDSVEIHYAIKTLQKQVEYLLSSYPKTPSKENLNQGNNIIKQDYNNANEFDRINKEGILACLNLLENFKISVYGL